MPTSRTRQAPRPTTASGPRRGAPPAPAGRRRLVVPLTVVLVAVALIVLAQLRDAPGDVGARDRQGDAVVQDGPVAEVIEPQEQPAIDLERRDPKDPLAAGPVDAPVVLIAYSDYQCPFCALWVEQTEPAMMELVDAGDLRIEWRDVNVFGPDSERAAQAAYAAGLQGRFWDYHQRLYAGGHKRTPEELTEGALVDLAVELGLEVDRFTTDLRSAEVAAAVQRNEDEGLGIGAYSTPTFLIGGRPVVGAQPTEVFVDAVRDALARAGR
jgi:protein-disulfide isomerase